MALDGSRRNNANSNSHPSGTMMCYYTISNEATSHFQSTVNGKHGENLLWARPPVSPLETQTH